MGALVNGSGTTASADFTVVAAGQSSNERPAVTVIVTLYNYRDYIAACLDSVKAQTIRDLDLVVVDDCSKDDSSRVARKWLAANGARFAGYRLLRHRVNRGLSKARNTAFANTQTEFVFVLDADNMIYPRCLESLVEALEHCDASFAHCHIEKFGEEHGLLQTRPFWNPGKFQHGNIIDAMVLLRRRVWQEVGGYSEDMLLGWEDFDLWFKIARKAGWGILVPEILARYRVHGTSMLRTITNPNGDKLLAYMRGKYPEFFTGSEAPSPMPRFAELELDLQRTSAQVQELCQELHTAQTRLQELDKIHASRSWKLTAPFRSAAHRLRRLQGWARKA